ncbi:DegT/DnrJ/EryC1/StrS family aminotransferase [Candidatus Pelagibacter bacterium nBUS_49]|uniref:DegT/DnrJ/EryC1/StrS family aminotransferase n=1 Tax=Candidatus Pelagibacter bacterium nBUS_49 TaxID=3374196 RepID=UPI003EB94906
MKNKNKISYSLTESVLESVDINSAIKVLKSKKITMGPKTKQIEAYFQNKIVKTNSLMVNSGSSANLLIFQCLINPMVKKLKSGDEVLIPAICWSTSLWPIIQSGLKVKFVDIDLSTLNIDLNDLKKKISKKTKALMLVHALGNCTDMTKLMNICKKNKIILIEDTCEALGSTYKNKPLGTFGDFSSFSFYYSHHITSGEGGMVCTKNTKYLEIIKSLRSHGWSRDLSNNKSLSNKYKHIDKNWIFINSGFNLRTTDVNAAIGLEQLKRIKTILSIRKYNFLKIKKSLLGNKKYDNQFTILNDQKDSNTAWFGIPIILNSNDKKYKQYVMGNLLDKGIMTRPIISGNFAKQPSIQLYKIKINYKLPNADLIDKKAFFLGLHNIKITNSKLKSLTDNIYSSL